jgi:hypothetical protein
MGLGFAHEGVGFCAGAVLVAPAKFMNDLKGRFDNCVAKMMLIARPNVR